MDASWNWTTKEDLEKLIGQAESIRLDFKQSRIFEEARERIADNLTKEVSAFANTEGGTVVIGIKETRERKARIASSLDKGVDIQEWWPERLQQLIESNVSPHLTGLRVVPVPLDETKTRFAYVIYVPQGNTAYQASNYLYYGRSEYESKPLPDHEVRLRMFRGKALNAVVRIVNCGEEETAVESVKRVQNLLSSEFGSYVEKLLTAEKYPIRRYYFQLVAENRGETNISEFKVIVDFSPNDQFNLRRFERTYKDGWPLYQQMPLPVSIRHSPTHTTPMLINIYPQDTYKLTEYEFYLPPDQALSDKSLVLNWTLYLSDTLPVRGQIDIVDEFARLKEGKL